MTGGALWFLVLLTVGVDGLVWGVAACTAYRAWAGPSRRWLGPALLAGVAFVVWDQWLFRELVHWAGFPRSGEPAWPVETAIQLAATGLGFRAGSEHARRGMAGAGAGNAAVEYRHRSAARRQPPGDAQADHPRPHDGDGELAGSARGAGRQSAAPFAGMTQTGSVGLISAALSRHPRPSRIMMGSATPFHKTVGWRDRV